MDTSLPRQRVRAPFSFHCTICYEAFNLSNRAPVVLPCGHTYICEPCCQRLDKCMECRTPLILKIKIGSKETEVIGPSSRYGHATGLSHTYTPIYETVTLPIPKNHVLMCLIDAAQKSSGEGKDDEEYESGDDDELVLRGMQILGSSSGTYVVRERKGLMVYPFPPKKTGSIPANRSGVELVRYGQSVQISRYENKIATVARGAGYILVDDSSQLVKVGEVTDEGCKLEATSKVIEMELEGLQNRVRKLHGSLNVVEKKLQGLSSLKKIDSVFGPIPEDGPRDEAAPDTSFHERNNIMHGPLSRSTQPRLSKKSVLKQDPPQIAETQSYDEHASSIFCAPALEPSRSFENIARYISGQQEEERESRNVMSNYFSTYWSGSRDEGDARSVNSPSNTTSNCQQSGIDFASGLSGHGGLSRARSVSSRQQRKVMMMSHY